MFREILRSRKIVIGLCLLLTGVFFLYLKSGKVTTTRSHYPGTQETRRIQYVPSPAPVRVRNTYQSRSGELERKIDEKIDRVISLIDDFLE